MELTGLPTRFIRPALIVTLVAICLVGCTSTTPKWIEQPWTPVESTLTATDAAKNGIANRQVNVGTLNLRPGDLVDTEELREPEAGKERASLFVDGSPSSPGIPPQVVVKPPEPEQTANKGRGILVDQPIGSFTGLANSTVTDQQQTVRGQDPGYPLAGQGGSYVPPANSNVSGQPYTTTLTPQQQNGVQVVPANTGTNQIPGYFDTTPPANYVQPNYADIDVLVRETQTGKMTFGAAYNSNSGLVGQIIIDERNFDILGFPKSFQEIVDGTAWRGRGQGFRMELVPGNEVQRYLVSFTEPYLFNSNISFSASGYFFDRRYFDWDEQRVGGRFSLGYRLTPDLSISAGLRLEDVDIHDPRVLTSPSLNAALGKNGLYLAQFSLINDTRDHPFMASTGSYLELSYNQGFGSFDYPRGDLDYRRYFLITQRPDGSGRHTLSFGTKAGFSGSATPIYENYFAGGFSTLRGYDFRGASPVENGVRVGGRFQWLNTLEYTFPITADDMFKGVLFCDFGTVEQNIEINWDDFRVAPGFGFRVHMPVGGAGGAPLAFDFAFPVNDADTDDRQVFSFYMGVLR